MSQANLAGSFLISRIGASFFFNRPKGRGGVMIKKIRCFLFGHKKLILNKNAEVTIVYPRDFIEPVGIRICKRCGDVYAVLLEDEG